MKQDPIKQIRALLQSNGYKTACSLFPLPPSGSDRQYYRITFDDHDQPELLVFYNPTVEENLAQIEFTQHFINIGLRVPKILFSNREKTIFAIKNLGKVSLFELALKNLSTEVVDWYKTALTDLVHFQVNGIKGFNPKWAYPSPDFDRRSIFWDLNYFKYNFLKPAGIQFNEYSLENDFQKFADQLQQSKPNFFCYRDFQARNIMIHQSKPWYIDFQGGRRGPLPYDVVSLLHQVKTQLPESLKEKLFQHYLEELGQLLPLEVDLVKNQYNSFVYFRLMQVLGAYGFRGLIEKKGHFIQSLPFAAKALRQRIDNHPLEMELSELSNIFTQITNKYTPLEKHESNSLTVWINSFSYKKKGPPLDLTGNGGGFNFDCRGLPNPHRIDSLRDLTGEDHLIKEYMREQPETKVFLESAFSLIDLSIDNYIARNFKNLQVNFGCTGGRHRSVFSAIQLQEHLKNKYPQITIIIHHHEIAYHNAH